jgi:hypothetical protein
MILGLAVILGLALSLARYGPEARSRITGAPWRAVWLAPLALALQAPLLRRPFGPAEAVVMPQVLFLLSHLLLIAFVWLNRRLAGMWLIGLGLACNLVVIVANGGLMPIAPETLVRINPGVSLEQCTIGYHYGFSKDIILPREGTRLWLLSDALVLPAPFPWPTAFSLGDLLLGAAIVMLIQGARPEPGTFRSEPQTACAAVSRVRGQKRHGSQYRYFKEQTERRFVR